MPPKSRADETLQEIPVVHIVGKIAGDKEADNGTGTKYLVHTSWTKKTYQVSSRGLKMLRSLDVTIIDEPAEYQV